MDISTNTIEHFGIVAGIFDELGIGEIIDRALPKTRHHKASHSAIIKAMALNGLGFNESRLYFYSNFFIGLPTERLLGEGISPSDLNDDTLGRTLDAILHHRCMSQSLISSCAYGIMGVMMPAAGTDTKSLTNAWRKTNEQELSNSLKIEYGFSPALARSLVQLMHEHIETNYGNLREDSQVIYHAISAKEGPGKSIDNLNIVPVTLTISHPDDAAVLKERGVPGLRKHKLLRFANEAYDQGGLLIQEDLALLLTTSIRTIQRDMQEMRKQGIVVPTRGEIQDIGPTVSHKTQIIELYLKGYEYTEIEQRTRHTGDSIKRYISGFSKVVLLSNKGYSVIQIRELTNSSEKVVSEYLGLYKIYKEIASDRLNQIASASIEKLDSKKGGLGVGQ